MLSRACNSAHDIPQTMEGREKENMTKKKQSGIISEGKTKQVIDIGGRGFVTLRNKDDMTKHDDPSQTEKASGKGEVATSITCKVFDILKKAGIPVAFDQRVDARSFRAYKLDMIPLEVVVRRYAVGSYLKRNPRLSPTGEVPRRFSKLEYELFLKTTDGECDFDNTQVASLPCDDPMIQIKSDKTWKLHDPKMPVSQESHVGSVKAAVDPKHLKLIEETARRTFLLLEGVWATLGWRLVDFKIEFGWWTNPQTGGSSLMIGDVIDGDSWRLRSPNWDEMSKECFRQGETASDVTHKYQLVNEVLQNFSITKDVVVIWTGSEKDDTEGFPVANNDWIETLGISDSGHKSTISCLRQLESLKFDYRNGVIIAVAGMSNGLGPILAAHTEWPLISCPPDDGHHQDIWSSLRMPSAVPNMTVLKPSNAMAAAYGILAQCNPYVYMVRRYTAESFDEGVVVE